LGLATPACQAAGLRVSRSVSTPVTASVAARADASASRPETPSTGTSSDSTSRSDASPPQPSSLDPADRHDPGASPPRRVMTYRDRALTVLGLTIEQAKQRLEEIGHTGKVTVKEDSEFHPDCRPGTVCGIIGLDYEAQDIVLYINK